MTDWAVLDVETFSMVEVADEAEAWGIAARTYRSGPVVMHRGVDGNWSPTAVLTTNGCLGERWDVPTSDCTPTWIHDPDGIAVAIDPVLGSFREEVDR